MVGRGLSIALAIHSLDSTLQLLNRDRERISIALTIRSFDLLQVLKNRISFKVSRRVYVVCGQRLG